MVSAVSAVSDFTKNGLNNNPITTFRKITHHTHHTHQNSIKRLIYK